MNIKKNIYKLSFFITFILIFIIIFIIFHNSTNFHTDKFRSIITNLIHKGPILFEDQNQQNQQNPLNQETPQNEEIEGNKQEDKKIEEVEEIEESQIQLENKQEEIEEESSEAKIIKLEYQINFPNNNIYIYYLADIFKDKNIVYFKDLAENNNIIKIIFPEDLQWHNKNYLLFIYSKKDKKCFIPSNNYILYYPQNFELHINLFTSEQINLNGFFYVIL